MTDEMITICERWERKGFDNGFRWGAGCVVVFSALVGLVQWWLK